MIPVPGDLITIREADPTDTWVWAFDGNDQPTCLSPSECYLCVAALENDLLLLAPGRRLLHVRDIASLLLRLKYVSIPATPKCLDVDWNALDAAFRLGGMNAVYDLLPLTSPHPAAPPW